MKEMFGMQTDLMLRSPKPDQIQSDAESNRQSANECSTKRNRHTLEFIIPGKMLGSIADAFFYLHILKRTDGPQIVREVIV